MSLNVAIVGAGGDTGGSIVDALLASTSPRFNVTAITRPSPTDSPRPINPRLLKFQSLGVTLLPLDLTGATPPTTLAESLIAHKIEIIICTMNIPDLASQIPLAEAAKLAQVKRFVPCFFGTVLPPGTGIMSIRDKKEDVLNHVRSLYLDFTAIDVGWWMYLFLPRVYPAKGDEEKERKVVGYYRGVNIDMLPEGWLEIIANEGDVPTAVTDLEDIGRAVARIIADERTVNKHVFVWGEMATQKKAHELVEGLTGRKIESKVETTEQIQEVIDSFKDKSVVDMKLIWYQYLHSWGVRGDNTPEKARWLGYLDAKELYPDMTWRTLEETAREVVYGPAASQSRFN